MKLLLTSESDTQLFATELWRVLPKQCLVFLHGQLGAGKTTLVRSLLRTAGHQGTVKSPTYTLVEEYDLQQRKVFHFDLYRLQDPEELEMLGIRDYFAQEALCFIEWAELGKGFLPAADISLSLEHHPQGRMLTLSQSLINQKKINTLHWKNKDILL